MASVSVRNGRLYFDFRYQGVRCREYTALEDTRANRKRMQSLLDKILAEITLGTFDYAEQFPGSPRARQFSRDALLSSGSTPLLREFATRWTEHKTIEWRQSYRESVANILETHVLPALGHLPVGEIDRDAVLGFRAALATKASGHQRAPATINKIVGILQTILDDAAAQYGFINPCTAIKRLKVRKLDIHPFTMDEVGSLIATARPDYTDYFTVRLLTGLRSGEVHGLRWRHIDLTRRQILVRETYSQGRIEYTKTDGSQRNVDMSGPVFRTLSERAARCNAQVDPDGYVFASRNGQPIDNKNFCNRVWYPLLRHLDLAQRRPYQMRHTAATLWLASGENPEWIAKQLGHTSTEMLFKTYSRYVPNLTRQDGSAFERVLTGCGLSTAHAGGVA